MTTQLEFEQKQSAMLRGISIDIKRDYEDIIYKLYDETYKGEGDYKSSAAEWALIISDYFTTNDVEKNTILINYALKNKVNLWEDKIFKLQMRIKLPLQFRRRLAEFTQVPRLAGMGAVPKQRVEKKRDSWSD